MWVLWVWYTPSFHRAEQGFVGTLTMVWYNTYTKKALYCIEFREGYTIHPIHVCVTAFSLNAWREWGWVVGGGCGHTTTSDDTSNIPWKDPVARHLTPGLFFFPSFRSLIFLFITIRVRKITLNLFQPHVSFVPHCRYTQTAQRRTPKWP